MTAISWDSLTREAGVISPTPVLFSIALLLALFPLGGAIYWILEKLYRGKINSLEGKVELLEGQIELLEKQLESSKTKIEKLIDENKKFVNQINE